MNNDHLPEDIQRFIELDKKKAKYKVFFEQYKTAIDDVIANHGIGKSFQDDEGTVYLTETQVGKFIYFEPFVVIRTRRTGEAKGSLSMKAARELEYIVEGESK